MTLSSFTTSKEVLQDDIYMVPAVNIASKLKFVTPSKPFSYYLRIYHEVAKKAVANNYRNYFDSMQLLEKTRYRIVTLAVDKQVTTSELAFAEERMDLLDYSVTMSFRKWLESTFTE